MPRHEPREAYPKLAALDGRHPFKVAVPNGYVDYQVRYRRGGRIAYFNFELAVEMGLVPKSAPHRLTRALKKALLDQFAIQIINEYDMIHGTTIPRQDIKPHRYMATRYLQLQHKDRIGLSSGDGRSVWNGSVTHGGVTWDVSSCGTGATCLSPATSLEKRFFQTGDPEVCYGCGSADLNQGLGAAIFSEILHKHGVPTERTLAVIDFGGGQSINVRASRNLLRPSHFFLHLKQGNYASLKAAVDFFIDRQVRNGEAGLAVPLKQRYQTFAEKMAVTFARSAAIFEANYLFVWMDWDGDNILANGGIIDYGSVRQFGLFHSEYRYDDDDRMSTMLTEQRAKARDMVQTFAQLRDYLLTGNCDRRVAFAKDPILGLFDHTFTETLLTLLLQKVGFDLNSCEYLMRYHRPLVDRFRAAHAQFERAKSKRGFYKVPDGITWDAIYSMRDVLREVPKRVLQTGDYPTPREFMEIMASSYATRRDRKLTPNMVRRINAFQSLYRELVDMAAHHENLPAKSLLLKITMRSALKNREDRVTGNAVLLIAERLAKAAPTLSSDELQTLVEAMIEQQSGDVSLSRSPVSGLGRKIESLAKTCLRLLKECKDGI